MKLLNMNEVMSGSRVYEIIKSEIGALPTEKKIEMGLELVRGDDSVLKQVLDDAGLKATSEMKANIKEEPIYWIAIAGTVVSAITLIGTGYFIGSKYPHKKKSKKRNSKKRAKKRKETKGRRK